jgi:hypothetical protein
MAKMGISLVRGIRLVATPIAIGYIWLVLAWLMIRKNLPSASEAKDVTGNIYEVATTMGKYLGLIVATVVAFMLGWLTVRLLMMGLALLRVPKDVRQVFLRRAELAGQNPSYGNFRPEPTTTYVLHGFPPPELYNLGRFVDDFRSLCAEVQFFWTVPLPLLVLEIYLSRVHSPWWLIVAAATPVLMIMGYRRYVLACRLLSRAGVAHAQQMHAQAGQAWFDVRPSLVG